MELTADIYCVVAMYQKYVTNMHFVFSSKLLTSCLLSCISTYKGTFC